MAATICECPLCQATFQVTPEMAGTAVQCPGCSRAIQLPEKLDSSGQIVYQAIRIDVCTCPSCQQGFGYTTQMLGTSVACPHCTASFRLKVDGTLVKEVAATNSGSAISGTSKEELSPQSSSAAASIPKPQKRERFLLPQDTTSGSSDQSPAKLNKASAAGLSDFNLEIGEKASRPLETALPQIRIEEGDQSERTAEQTRPPKPTASPALPPVTKVTSPAVAEKTTEQPPTFPSGGAAKQPEGAALLPPKFYSSDPTIIRQRKGSRIEQPFVLLPDATGGSDPARRGNDRPRGSRSQASEAAKDDRQPADPDHLLGDPLFRFQNAARLSE
jgi:DNA-directed RNA polymerase subunit RPC12/RpoP